MRLFLLPISTRRTLIYGQKTSQIAANQKSYVDRITAKAATTWVNWEKSQKSWQKTITVYGNAALKRIAYEEWGLKSIAPLSAAEKEMGSASKKVEVAYPSTMIREDRILGILRQLATERQTLHWKKMWWSIAGMPLTAPVALIPIIPNLPFFYLVFRAWSHWKALSGSKHLEFLVSNNLITPNSLKKLDVIYPVDSPLPGFRDGRLSADSQELMVLESKDGARIANVLEVPELAPEIERAVWQVEESLKAKEDAGEGKREALISKSLVDKIKR